jgi:hypothetical protein
VNFHCRPRFVSRRGGFNIFEKHYGSGRAMTIKAILSAAVAAATLTACGGGGGGSSSAGGSFTSAPIRTTANTSNSAYLPLLAGNTWTFQSGGIITDAGAIQLVCSCPISNKSVERLNVTDPNGTFGGAFYFAKGAWPSGANANHRITYLVGVRTATATSITPTYQSTDGSIPGVPAMDDTPANGEVLGLSTMIPSNSTTTTFQSVGGTQAYGTNQVIVNMASATVTSGGTSVGFIFAQGVGYASVNTSTQTNLLTSFSINALNSLSVKNVATERVNDSAAEGDAAGALRSVATRL